METGVTVKVCGLEDIKKQAAVVREKMRELDQELGKMERALYITTEINQPPEETAPTSETKGRAVYVFKNGKMKIEKR